MTGPNSFSTRSSNELLALDEALERLAPRAFSMRRSSRHRPLPGEFRFSIVDGDELADRLDCQTRVDCRDCFRPSNGELYAGRCRLFRCCICSQRCLRARHASKISAAVPAALLKNCNRSVRICRSDTSRKCCPSSARTRKTMIRRALQGLVVRANRPAWCLTTCLAPGPPAAERRLRHMFCSCCATTATPSGTSDVTHEERRE